MLIPLSVPLDALELPEHHVLNEAIQFAVRHQPVIVAEGAGFAALDCEFAAWASLADEASNFADPDERDEIEELIETLERSFSEPPLDLEVRLSGLVARKGSALSALLGGRAIDWSAERDWPVQDGKPLKCGPTLASFLAVVFEYNRAMEDAERRRAALLLNRRKHHLERSHGAARCTVNVDPSLALKGHARARKLEVRVEEAKADGARVTVSTAVVVDDGRHVPISSATLDRTGAFLQLQGSEFVELTEPMRDAVNALRAWSRPQAGFDRRELEARGALAHPQLLLAPKTLEAAGDTLEFWGFSDRVISFRPLDPSEVVRPRDPSGVQWFEDDRSASDLFAFFKQRDAKGEVVASVELETRQDAEQALEQCESMLAADVGEAQPVRIGDTVVADPASLASAIRAKIAADDLRLERGVGQAPETRPRRETLVADLRDAEEATAASTIALVEPPWELLENVLSEDIVLRPHQREGLRWLWSRYVYARETSDPSVGCLLADDMGLGKTLQVACLLVLATHEARSRGSGVGPSLVVAPKILLAAWQREIEKCFKPRTLAVRIVGGADLRPGASSLVDDDERPRARSLQEYDVWITNYDTVQSRIKGLGATWNIVVLDEAQNIKNGATAASRNCAALSKVFGVASTGTPVENVLSDVFAIADFAFPGVLAANVREFDSRFPARDPDALKRLRKRLAFGHEARSCVLRREKTILADELGEKHVHIDLLPMAGSQLTLENQIERAARSRRGAMMQAIQELRKLYQHPVLVERNDAADNAPLHVLLDESPKLRWLQRKLREIENLGEKVLIFTESHRMQRILRRLLSAEFPERIGDRNIVINGDPSNIKTALTRIDAFSAVPGFNALILSPTAAGTGLTITAANHVVHYGRWWNPAREDQATDRAYRIGQLKDVHVWIPILHHPNNSRAGFDVRLEELMRSKRSLASDFLAPPMINLTDDELGSLFAHEQGAQ
jgi:hypothetical protein